MILEGNNISKEGRAIDMVNILENVLFFFEYFKIELMVENRNYNIV